jgi:uncharacterized protein
LSARALAAGLLLWASGALAFSVPPVPSRFVYDGANALSSSEKGALEDRILALDRQYGVQIGVAILPSLDGESVEGATLRIAEAWKPGYRGKDNGIVIAIFMAERRMRIEVGYGLEGSIPDALANRIIQEQIAPEFRAGQVAEGLTRGANSLALAATGQPLPSPVASARVRQPPRAASGLGCLLVMVAFVILSAISRALRPRHYGFRHRSRPIPWWMWLLIGQGTRPGRSWYSGSSHRGGSGWGGGFGGGSGGSFGGGSFGGGGASGRW